MNLPVALVGPLAGPECRRALGRGWLILVRVLAALALWGTALVVLWIWWMNQETDPDYQPYQVVRIGLAVVEGMLVTIALVLGPAVLAGSIAGEKERGVMALLLTTCVSSREIIAGRLAGKLAQVAMILMAGVPALIALAALAGMNPGSIAVLLALPAAVAMGGGGLSILTSTVSRRGRDALLTVYLIDVFFLLSPLGAAVGVSSRAVGWLGALNPYLCLNEMVWDESPGSSYLSIGLWLAIGLLSTASAAWRLRAASLRPLDGERVLRQKGRRGRVPQVDEERPMLWKELFVEHVGALGGLGWWLGAFLVVCLAGGSLILGGLIAWDGYSGGKTGAAFELLATAVVGTTSLIGWLIEWGVGLRAAVAISSERERGTWDALLTSPLEGREIVRAKLWGSLYALRWLFAATLLAWTLAAVTGAFGWPTYAKTVIDTVIIAAFMAAVGVRTSLSTATATRAMTITIGTWLGASVVVPVLSAIAVGCLLAAYTITASLASYGAWLGSPAWLSRNLVTLWWLIKEAIFLAATLLIVVDTRIRFDRIAGRLTGGQLASAVDALIHGRPHDPWRRKGSTGAKLPPDGPAVDLLTGDARSGSV